LIRDFLFAEFAEGQPVEVLRIGTFRDMNGQEVEIGEEDLEAYVANFAAGTAGQEVPIDVDHERAEAAGWLTALYREGDTLLARVDWNALGKQLVGERIYKYLSATISTAQQVIKSVSLVNFPAVKGLAAVELSEGIYGLERLGLLERVVAAVSAAFGEEPQRHRDTEGGEEREETEESGDEGVNLLDKEEDSMALTEEELAELREQIRGDLEAEMAEKGKVLVELRAEVREEVEAELAEEFERRKGLLEFAEEITGGEAGLSASADTVADFLAALPESQVELAQAMLSSKVVEFGERGSERDGSGEKLAPEMAAALVAWRAGDGSIEEFFELNAAELGEMDGYDLTEFKKEENDG